MENLKQKVADCKACELCKTNPQKICGNGDVQAKIMIVGEAGGKNEAKQGKPFCGMSGKLLDIGLKSGGLSRERVWVTNCLKCRPPDNRQPTDDELIACRVFITAELDIVKPKLLVLLGRTAIKNFLPELDTIPIRELRGEVFEVAGLPPMIITYHPTAALRNKQTKGIFLTDVQNLGRIERSL